MLATIKAKLIGAGAVLLGVLAVIFRMKSLKRRAEKAERRAAEQEVKANEYQGRDEIRTELDQQFSDLERERQRDVKQGDMPRNIRNRNDY